MYGGVEIWLGGWTNPHGIERVKVMYVTNKKLAKTGQNDEF